MAYQQFNQHSKLKIYNANNVFLHHNQMASQVQHTLNKIKSIIQCLYSLSFSIDSWVAKTLRFDPRVRPLISGLGVTLQSPSYNDRSGVISEVQKCSEIHIFRASSPDPLGIDPYRTCGVKGARCPRPKNSSPSALGLSGLELMPFGPRFYVSMSKTPP